MITPDIENMHPRIIRVWFDTVLNPIIDGLKREGYYVNKKNWTWRSFNNNFEYIKCIQQYINIEYSDNAEQFYELFPQLKEISKDHDNEVDILNLSCDKLFESLMFDKGIEEKVVAYVTRLVNDNKNQSIKLDDLQNIRRLICEYIVNNTEELNSSYIIHPIWNPNRKLFLSYLEQPNIKSKYEDLVKVGDSFLIVIEKSLAEFKKLRNMLSIKYGVPIKVPRIEHPQYSSQIYG